MSKWAARRLIAYVITAALTPFLLALACVSFGIWRAIQFMTNT